MTEKNEDLDQVEEQAIDALLMEVVGNATPPDLSRDILQQLRATPLEKPPVVRTGDRAVTKPDGSIHKQVAVVVAVVVSLAATLFLAVWYRPDRSLKDSSVAEAPVESDFPDYSFPMADSTGSPDRSSRPAPERESSRGIPLVGPSTTPDRSTTPDDRASVIDRIADAPARQPPPPMKAVSLVSRQVDQQLRKYWGEIGIAPSPEAEGKAIVERLSTALGVELPADAVKDPQKLQREFAKDQASRQIAARWLEQISQRGLFRVDQEARGKLVADLAGCFHSDQPFDQTLAGWISRQSPNSPAFYAALSSGANDFANNSAMVRRMASLTMNVDLRCIRCHDSHIAGDGRQQDYWAFAAFLRHGLADDSSKVRPLFYDLPDGRRRIAEPGIAAKWMGNPSAPAIGDLRQWSQQLIGSEELAHSVVNSLWQLVHGQPLRGRVVDPISAPHADALDQLEQDLAEDLVASKFDIARTLALIVASPVTQRAVPESLLAKNALLADEAETRTAMDAVDAFAAALPTRPRSGINSRLDEAMRAIGMKLSDDGQSFVAQIGDTTGGASGSKDSPLSVDFPYRAGSLPVQWLGTIEDQRSQVEHLGYLAGIDRLPDRIVRAAESMRAAEVDNDLTLHRIWWILRP